MSATGKKDGLASGGSVMIGARFGLGPEDAVLMVDLCSGLLQEAGIDGDRFLARIGQGEDIGEALGLPADLTELLYARAHRWFSVDRTDRAEPLFRALCVLDGQVADYWIGLGICLRLRDSFNEAALAFSTAARLRPLWAVPAFHSAELAILTGDYSQANAHLARFEETTDHATPERMAAEVARMTAALLLRRTGASNSKNTDGTDR